MGEPAKEPAADAAAGQEVCWTFNTRRRYGQDAKAWTDSAVLVEERRTREELWVAWQVCYSSVAASTCSTTPSLTVRLRLLALQMLHH